jgi:hypothetical protein
MSGPDPRFVTARVAGALYLAIIVFGLFAEVVVRGSLIEPGDAAATAENVLASEWLFRAGFAADLIVFLCDVALAVVLYVLLRPVSRTLSLLAAAFRLTQTAIIGFNLLNMFMALFVLRQGTGDSATLALLYLEAHKYGYILGLTFFGVSTGIVGYLAYRSSHLPNLLGLLLGLAGVGYLTDSFLFFLVPGYAGGASAIILAPALFGELWLCLWLLLARARRPFERTAAIPVTA